MKKNNGQLEMTQAWLDIYMNKMEDIPGDTISRKIDYLVEYYKSSSFGRTDFQEQRPHPLLPDTVTNDSPFLPVGGYTSTVGTSTCLTSLL